MKALAEVLIWVAAAALAFLAPVGLEPVWEKAEAGFRALARRRWLSCLAVGLLVLAGRAALLVVWDLPQPVVLDEFGYLLQGETFASGRLTNPTHPEAEFFEAPYVLQQPTYTAKFPPGQGLALAVGVAVFGHPWWGVWLSCGLLAAALCWALQGWLEPEWALAGALVTVPFLTITYCMNSYWGGAVAGIGGALVYGAAGRMGRVAGMGAVFAAGAVVLALTRPFEGLLALLPMLVFLRRLAWREWGAMVLVGAAGMGFLGLYNLRVTGDALRLPYVEYERQNPMTSHFSFVPLPPQKEYVRAGMQVADHWERTAWEHTQHPGFLWRRMVELRRRVGAYFGTAALLIPAIALAGLWLRRRELWAVLAAVVLMAGAGMVETVFFGHYATPLLAGLLVLAMEGLRQLRGWQGRHGVWMARLLPVAALLIAAVDPAAKLVKGESLDPPGAGGRAFVEDLLAPRAGEHVVLVRHNSPSPFEPKWEQYPSMELTPTYVEFVYNGANIDGQRVVWAHDLGEAGNQKLRGYFKGRTFWLYDPAVNDRAITRMWAEF